MLLLALAVHSAPTDIVPEATRALADSPFVSAVQEEPFESAGEDANSELTGDIEESADEEDAATSLAQLTSVTELLAHRAPSGFYKGTTNEFGETIDATITVDDASHADITVKASGIVSVDLDCKKEGFTLGSSGKIALPGQSIAGDCIHDALQKYTVDLKSVTYDVGSNSIELIIHKILNIKVKLTAPESQVDELLAHRARQRQRQRQRQRRRPRQRQRQRRDPASPTPTPTARPSVAHGTTQRRPPQRHPRQRRPRQRQGITGSPSEKIAALERHQKMMSKSTRSRTHCRRRTYCGGR